MKDSFLLYQEYKEIFETLTDEEAGKLIKAIFEYEDTGQTVKLDKSLKLAFIPIKNTLDRNKEKYEKVVERNKENGKKGGRPKKPKNPVGYLGYSEKPKKADSDNDNEHDNDSDNDNELTTTVVNNVSDSCVDGLQKVIDFYNENVGLITPYGIEVLEDYSKEMPVDLIIYAMQISVEANKRTIQYIKAILNNWQKAGIKTLAMAKEENHKKKNNDAEEWLNE